VALPGFVAVTPGSCNAGKWGDEWATRTDALVCTRVRTCEESERAFRDEERAVFKDLKQSLGRDIALRPDAQLHHEQFDLMAIG
jgi:hypothetical protein